MDINYLETLLRGNSASGNEGEVAHIFCSRLFSICDCQIDSIGNAICKIDNESSFSIMLEAHSDEVGMQVTGIDEMGFVHVRRNGSIDNMTLLGQSVIINGNKGAIRGIIGKKPIHLNGCDQEKSVAIEDMFIDIGADSKATANTSVSIGDYVTLLPNVLVSGHRVVSKGLDDKIGLFIISEATKILKEEPISHNIYSCASAQEEVGCRGCKIAIERIKPDIAICVDVGFATDYPGMDNCKYGKMELGKGVVINYNCDNTPQLVNLAKKVAEQKNIPFQQYTFLSSTGGTDASIAQISNQGVRTILLSIPCRYMHTPVEVCDLRDVESCINLIVELVKEIHSQQMFVNESIE